MIGIRYPRCLLSGLGAVLWSSYTKSSICVYVLNKISNSWKCRFYGQALAVITDDDQACNRCVWCDRETKNSQHGIRGASDADCCCFALKIFPIDSQYCLPPKHYDAKVSYSIMY